MSAPGFVPKFTSGEAVATTPPNSRYEVMAYQHRDKAISLNINLHSQALVLPPVQSKKRLVIDAVPFQGM